MSKSSNETKGSTNGAIIMDDRLQLNAQQAVNLRELYIARKQISEKIAFAEDMLGIQGREIVGGDLGEENPHLMLKPEKIIQ